MHKVKAYKKLSLRKRLRLEGITTFGTYPVKKASIDRLVHKFICEGTCRHNQPLGNPCFNFDAEADGICRRDERTCDQVTEAGERYRRGYE